MCNDSLLAKRKVLMYTAVLVSAYDVEPAKGESWGMPVIVTSAVSKQPFWPGKVWIKRRKLDEK